MLFWVGEKKEESCHNRYRGIKMDRTEQKKEAKKLYQKGWKLKDIAQKINVPQGTVRRWKAEEEWDGEQPNKKSERSPNARTKKRTLGRERQTQRTDQNRKRMARQRKPANCQTSKDFSANCMCVLSMLQLHIRKPTPARAHQL